MRTIGAVTGTPGLEAMVHFWKEKKNRIDFDFNHETETFYSSVKCKGTLCTLLNLKNVFFIFFWSGINKLG